MIRHYLSLIRFSHTVFALPFAALATLWAIVVPLANAQAALSKWQLALRILGVLVCMVAARSAAMAFNRLADQRFDAENPRTATRHLPAGALSKAQVWWFFGSCCLLFVAATALFLPNRWPLILALPVLLWICGYSYAKRFTRYAHLWLGAALALSPICAWVGIRGEELSVHPWDVLPSLMLGLSVALWVAGFDIIYACQDAEFDQTAGLHSIPAKMGVAGALKVSSLLHLFMWLVLAAMPLVVPQLNLGVLYIIGLAIVGMLLARQHWIVRPNDLSRVGEAFFTLNAIISFGITTIAALDLWW